MTQRRMRAIEDSDRVTSGSTMRRETAAQARSGPEQSPQQVDRDRSTEEIRTCIQKLAYELYQRRGRQDGYDRQDWLEAERLTLAEPTRTRQDRVGRLPTSSHA
ncbi:MAG: DUF2934 domain-containing protein [Nitrospira sp.]|jgi:hypothetical protein|nr:DUF2934 domain-containing protein [Nitrospira sp.]